MFQKYRATLTGNQIQWLDEIPASLTQKPTQVYIVFLESESRLEESHETTLKAFKEIESGNGQVFKTIDELFEDLEN